MIHAGNAFLAFLLALTITLSSLLTHGAGDAHAGLAASETANVHAISMCGSPSNMSDGWDGCDGMAGHCLIASCETYSLSQPSPIRIDISHPALQAKSYRIFATIEIPPPR
ncbi:hypothetical protein GLP59_19150 [Sulfitobacter sp. M220]|jgi:hypothetical protein|uniref:Uncharacterized protein n=2 Tax=root TaxID=1 RepID=A0A1H0UX67_9RHOB|nr:MULTISPECIES: hypothetical protein [Sulfitobacter]MCF7779696.1 hypothetical protein [Sulfitobacter sp. M220]SDP70675.1 hypothetical protein SAMN04488512_12929 [Sulfitobacter litoralis]HDZ53664.1 hypothetical protein [Sulfitobacter litoralis]|tara:strand:+ start:188 stop:520 length:333 start_codon:yes stop_codon:yes gene_type:complete